MPPCAGFPVYGVGQPSEAGFSGVADKVNPKDKLIWFNMRQEPVAYVGGKSVTPRKTPNPHHNIEIPGKVADMEALEVSVKQTCKQSASGLQRSSLKNHHQTKLPIRDSFLF